jgi:formylglycine-generating enzyme required for sulfatase activity
MKKYTARVPGSDITFEMIPIPGGAFTIGSPAGETGRRADEGPQQRVTIEPFWMGKCEVTWDEYEPFMYRPKKRDPQQENLLVDAVTRPTKPFVDMSFGMGKKGYPAICMTQHAASKYCEWLSAKTGHFYRLPTEAEWEYACRAGTTTAYSFGDDVSRLDEYAWHAGNSDGKYQKVGAKKPNPWGLHDMHGNVMEWTLDQYLPDRYGKIAGASSPWAPSTRPYPQVVRGGSWNDEAKDLRSAARRGSDKSWKIQDPQLPKSIWYHTDAPWLGFRIVRPLKVPPAKESGRGDRKQAVTPESGPAPAPASNPLPRPPSRPTREVAPARRNRLPRANRVRCRRHAGKQTADRAALPPDSDRGAPGCTAALP